MDPSLVLAFVTTVALLCLTPGPDILFVMAHGSVGGARAGVVAASGVSAGLLVHTAAAAAGLTVLVAALPHALDVVRILGAVVLAWLAVSTWRSAGRDDTLHVATGGDRPGRSLRRVFVLAAVTNLGNPKVVVFFLAFLPQFLSHGPSAWSPGLQIAALGALFIAISLVVDGTAGLLSGKASSLLRSRPLYRRLAERAAATVYAGLAGRLLVHRP